ncbi:translation initiation factor IF-2 [Parablautia sp. Marseille-Q6255]|uniref:translation initiation factor IF-2 n=1 Tax=Parablautia sp. Marseille-Q6255 TaxID=3039593 RepID=UPI0024BC5CDF|nr:translation initiation factor IF-2 [Parablautia sp. Marseille-Q6255]
MAKIRVHELAKELNRENKEIIQALLKNGVEVKSHMSNVEETDAGKIRVLFRQKPDSIKEDERMEQNPDKMVEKDSVKKTEGEGGTHPKKKNIIQVFRPQNSKTGMVKPGSRPRPQGAKPRTQSQSGAKAQQPVTKAQSTAESRSHSQTAQPSQVKTAEQVTVQVQAKQQTEVQKTSSEAKTQPVKAQEIPSVQTKPAQTPAASQTRPQAQSGNRYQGDGGNRSQTGRYQGDGGNRGQGGRYSNDGGNRGQGGRYSNDGGNRGQGGRYSNDGGNRGQGGRYSNDGGNRGQGGRYSNDGGNRGQGGRYSNDGGNRGQGGRYSNDGGNRGQGGRYSNDGGNRGQGGRYQGEGAGRGRSVNIPKAPAESKPLEKESRKRTERGDRNRSDKGDKLERMEKNVRQNGKNGFKKNQNTKAPEQKPAEKPEETIRTITLPERLTISELAEAMKVQPSAVVKKLFLQGTMVTVNQEVDFDKAEEIALEFNCICEKEVKVNVIEELLKEEDDAQETLVPRSPVVCVMGHVDHGKTSLLDAIRNTHVIDKEAGGITQHIGAYVVSVGGQKITFLDTPGHEAFTAMRMRGANATDIAILVVAADDGVMPQTVEAISHAKAAGIEIIVAINKIDKPSANVDRVKQELSEYELIPEDWGGSTIFVPVSAHTQEGIDTLLEMILLTAEVSELKANPKRKARGLVIEAELDKGKGPVATVLVQKGTLHVGDPIAAGSCYGKVRAMMDDKGRRVKEAGPSTPVEILGFSDVPNAGEIFMSMDNEKEARSFAETFISEGRERMLEETKARMSLDDLFTQIQAGNLKELGIIVKADVQGSVEAVKQSLLKLSNEEVVVKIIHGGVGAINESDVTLASASNAIIIGFNVRPDATAKATAEREGVDVRLYRVIYDAIADVEAAMKGMLDPVFEEKVIGHAEVRQTFKASGVGTIAGSYVLDGVFQRGCSARIMRDDKVIFDGAVASLKRFKDDVKEVKAGYECGLVFEKFNDIKEEDRVEAYTMVEVPR